MVEISNDIVSVVGPTTTTANAWQTVLTLNDAKFTVDAAKYAVWVVGKIGTDNISDPAGEWRMMEDLGGGGEAQLLNSYNRMETGNADETLYAHPFIFFTVFTQPATAVELVFQQESTDGTTLVRTDDMHLLFMRLDADLTEDVGSGGDWKYANDDSGPTAHTTSPVSRLALTWTPLTASHDWLIWVNGTVNERQVANNFVLEIFDSTGTAVLSTHSREPEDNTDVEVFTRGFWAVLENLPASAQTVQFRSYDDGGSTFNQYDGCEIFVLDMDSVFVEHFYQHTAARLQQTDSDWKEINNLEFTPAAATFLLMGGVQADAQNAGRRHSERLQIEESPTTPVTVPSGFDADPTYTQTFDATDNEYTTTLARESLSAVEQDYDHDARWSSSSGTGGWVERRLLALSMELAAAPAAAVYPPFPRRQNTLVRM